MGQTVKYIKETDDAYTIGGYGVVWGGRDIFNEYFTKATDFWLDRITATPPVLYEHGRDETTGKSVLGQVTSIKADSTGLWVEAQLEKSRQYVDLVMELIGKGVLGYSTGSVIHLAEITKGGQITSWPIVEVSLTPDPAEPRTLGVAELEAEPAVKSMLDAINAAKALPSGPTPMHSSDGSYPDGSYESLTMKLAQHARAALTLQLGQECWGYVAATFTDYFVFCHEFEETYRVAYSMGEDGSLTLGEWQEVEPAYVPKNESDMDSEAAPVALTAARFAQFACTLAERTKGLSQRRAAEGRPLSAANVGQIAKAKAAALEALAELDALVADDSEPGTKDLDSDGLRTRIAIQAERIRMLAS